MKRALTFFVALIVPIATVILYGYVDIGRTIIGTWPLYIAPSQMTASEFFVTSLIVALIPSLANGIVFAVWAPSAFALKQKRTLLLAACLLLWLLAAWLVASEFQESFGATWTGLEVLFELVLASPIAVLCLAGSVAALAVTSHLLFAQNQQPDVRGT